MINNIINYFESLNGVGQALFIVGVLLVITFIVLLIVVLKPEPKSKKVYGENSYTHSEAELEEKLKDIDNITDDDININNDKTRNLKSIVDELKSVENKNTTMVKMVKDLGVSQMGYLVLNNVDAILLMGYLGPIMVSIYTTYNYILRFLSEVSSRIQIVSVYSFGNVLASREKEEKIVGLYKESFVLFSIISFSLSLTFLLGIRTFVNLWINDPTYILDYRTAILFTATLFLGIIYYPLLTLINADGQFKANKNHILICASINLVLSFALIKPYGIDGLLFATSLAYFVNIILKAKDTAKTNLKKLGVYKLVITYLLTVAIFLIVSYLFKYIEIVFFNNIHSILTCIIGLGITFIILIFLTTAIMYVIVPATKELLNRGKNLIKRKAV